MRKCDKNTSECKSGKTQADKGEAKPVDQNILAKVWIMLRLFEKHNSSSLKSTTRIGSSIPRSLVNVAVPISVGFVSGPHGCVCYVLGLAIWWKCVLMWDGLS